MTLADFTDVQAWTITVSVAVLAVLALLAALGVRR